MKNRANTLAAILGNMEDLEGAYESALNSEGSALKENEAYLDSIQGRIDLFKNSLQTMWMNFIDSSVIKFVVDLGTALIKAADSMGVLSTAAGAFTGIKSSLKSIKEEFKAIDADSSKVLNIFGSKKNINLDGLKDSIDEITEAQERNTDATIQGAEANQLEGQMSVFSAEANQQEAGSTNASTISKKVETGEITKNTAATWANVAATKALAVAKSLIKGALIGLAISAITSAIGKLINAASDAAKRMDELTDSALQSADAVEDTQDSIEDYKEEIRNLRKELDSNKLSESEAYESRQRLIEIQNELIDRFGGEANGINLVTGAIENQISAIDELSKKSADEWLNDNMEAYVNAQKTMKKQYDTSVKLNDALYTDAYKKAIEGPNTPNRDKEIEAFKKRSDFLENEFAKKVESLGGKYESDYLSNDFTGEIDRYLEFENKTAEEIDNIFTELMNYVREYSVQSGVDYSELLSALSKERKKYVDEDYLDAKELYDKGRQQQAISEYADEYGDILDAQEEIYTADTDEAKLKAIQKYNDAVKAGQDEAKRRDQDYMSDYFSDMGTKFEEQEFELKVKLDEDGLKTNLEDIIAEGGEKGLSTLDDIAIKDMVDRGLNVEGATDESGKYTEEQISGLIALQTEADNAGISIESLISILTNLGLIAGQPVAEAADTVEAVGQAYSTLASSVEQFASVNEILNEAIYDNIEISEEQYEILQNLIGSEEEFADCIDTTNGYVVKNTSLLRKLVAQKKKEQAADVKLAKSQARLEYYDLVKQLNNTLNGTKVLDSATKDVINTTFEQIDAVKLALYQYQLLEDSLLGLTNAFDEFAEAQEIDSMNTYGDSYVEMVQTMYDGLYKTGQVGTEAFWSAVEALVPDSVYQSLTEDADRMKAIYDYFNKNIIPSLQLEDDQFSMDYESIENFVDKALDKGVFKGNAENFDLVEGMNLEKAAELMDMTTTQAYAFFAELDKYNTSGTEQSFLAQLDDSLEGKITNITSEMEDLNKQKLALLEDGGYEKNKDAIDEINQKLQTNEVELNKLGQEAYTTWQSYTQNDAVIAALSEVEDKTAFLTKEGATNLGLEWDEVKGQTVQQALDNLLAKQLELEEPTILTAQLAIDNIDSQITALETSINNNDFSNVDPVALGLKIDATPEEIKAAIESKIAGLKEDKAVISTTFGIELSEEEKAELENELNAIEDFTIHDKEFSVIVNGVSETNQSLNSVKDTLDKIKDKSITLTTYDTTYKSTKKYNPQTKTWEYSSANGTAHAHGTANKSGSWGAPKTETALVGELGPELLVRNGRWTTVGDNGAEFAQVKKGDIIFNHKQTEDLLSKGYVTGRGKAYATGTAYAGLWKPTSPDESLSNKPGRDFSTAASSLDNAASNVSDAADEFKEVFDWIEIRLEEINKDLSFKSARLENTVGYSKQNAVINQMLDLNEKLYNNLIAGANKYYEYAGTLLAKIPAEYRQAAQDGSIAIETFVGEVDEETYNAIQEYREWVQKGDDAVQQAEEVITEVSSLAKQAIDNIATDFGNKNSLRDSKIDQLDAYNALTEAKYGSESEAIYKAIIKETNKNIKTLQTQRDKMQAELDKQVREGNIQKYSQDWYDAVNDIAAVDTEIINLTADTYDYQDSINELHWDHFDNLLGRLEAISDESDNLIDILSSKDLVDESGNWTREGITSLGLYAQKMEVAEMQAKKYKDEINYLNKNWKKLGYTEQEYVEKLEELKEGQYDSIKAYNDTKKAIVDLNKERIEAIKEGIEREIEAYEELINKKKEELDAEKDIHDFQKNVADQQKNIADIERKIAALSADNSASARAQRAKLEAELLEAQADLQETYYDRSITDQQNALDKELENFKENKDEEIEGWDEYLENTEQVVADSLSTVQTNTDVVYQTLKAMGKEYSLSIAESLTSPWKDGENAIQSFSEKFGLSMSSTVEELQKLADEYKKIMDEIANAGNEAIKQVNDNATRYQQAVNPSKPKFDNPETVVKPVTPSGGGSSSSQSSHAGAISGLSGYLQQGSTGSNVKTLQQALNDLGFNAGAVDGIFGYNTKQAVMRFQSSSSYGGAISADGIVGPNTKKKFKAAGYAKGTSGVKKNQLALIDELGEELQLVPDGNGRLAYLKKGTAIIPHDISENLMQLGQLNPQDILDRNRPTINAPYITNNNIELNVSFGEVVHIEHVDNDAVPNLAKTVEKQIDKYMKNLNGQIRKYTR